MLDVEIILLENESPSHYPLIHVPTYVDTLQWPRKERICRFVDGFLDGLLYFIQRLDKWPFFSLADLMSQERDVVFW